MKQSRHQVVTSLVSMQLQFLFLQVTVSVCMATLTIWPRRGWYVQTGDKDREIRFQCLGGGARVVWSFNGNSLMTSSPCNQQSARAACGPVLHIRRFELSYAGVYTCKDPATDREAHVRLEVQPEFISPQSSTVIVAVGRIANLECLLAPNIYPPASVVWQKRVRGVRRTVYTGERYTIRAARLEDSGEYVCTARNSPHHHGRAADKFIVLKVYVPGSCSLVSSVAGKNNFTVTIRLSGTSNVGFLATNPWYQLPSNASGVVAVTRPSAGFSGEMKQTIGLVTQVVTGAKDKPLTQSCSVDIDPPNKRLKTCLLVWFAPNTAFCKVKPSFNVQAEEVIKQLVADMHDRLQCHYTGDIHAVFVQSDAPCSPFKIGVTTKSDTSSLSCQSSARVDEMLLNWTSTYGTVRMLSAETASTSRWQKTYCVTDNKAASRNDECHRVVYCYLNAERRDRIVCRTLKGFYRKNKHKVGTGTMVPTSSSGGLLSSRSLRSSCSSSLGH